jgi:tetratricopeptide (TPR) repeat protein
MPQIDAVEHKTSMKPWLFAGGVLVLLLACGYLLWRLVPTPAQSMKQAEALMQQGDFSGAFNVLQGAYNRAFAKSDRVLLLSEMAGAKSGMKDHAGALQMYRQLNDLAPNNYSYLVEWGDEAYDDGDKADAVKAYTQALDTLGSGASGPVTHAAALSMQTRLKVLQ